MARVLLTGVAGFIGASIARRLIQEGYEVFALDNLNSYYSPVLKEARLKQLGISLNSTCLVQSKTFSNFYFDLIDISSKKNLFSFFQTASPDIVIHLAAQAGVRYSITHPYSYADSNLMGFLNIIEACKEFSVSKLIFASSSSVYGQSSTVPYREDSFTDAPVSFYAATKKANEVMAHAYAHLYGISSIGLRFFTVYGPWGRPDMAPFLFANSIVQNLPLKVFNHGHMMRDFTYISDIVEGTFRIVELHLLNKIPFQSTIPFRIYNIGSGHPIPLLDFIHYMEDALSIKARLQFVDMQPGDVLETYADTSRIYHDTGFIPSTSIKDGVSSFIEWYKSRSNPLQ